MEVLWTAFKGVLMGLGLILIIKLLGLDKKE